MARRTRIEHGFARDQSTVCEAQASAVLSLALDSDAAVRLAPQPAVCRKQAPAPPLAFAVDASNLCEASTVDAASLSAGCCFTAFRWSAV